jgi:exodeoxyribonuclease V beta subunit
MNGELAKELNNPKAVWNKLGIENEITRDAIIEASAGTGKTYTLQRIVLKLLTEKKVDSIKNVLLVTYTDKAAGELKDRIRNILEKAGLLPLDFDEVSICTIHSFCNELLQEYAFENRVPMEMDVGVSDKALIRSAIRKALKSNRFKDEFGCDFSTLMESGMFKNAEALLSSVDKRWRKGHLDMPTAKAGKVSKQIAKQQAQAKLINGLLDVAESIFTAMKSEQSSLSFDDMIARVDDIVSYEYEKSSSALLDSIRRKYRIVLIDEFQDTDDRQWRIFKKIFSYRNNVIDDGPHPHNGFLISVGDPKQAIYSFRGADIKTYLDAKEYIIDLNHGQSRQSLDTTYRSRPELVNAFNKIFAPGNGWFDGMSEGGGEITYESVNPPPEDNNKFCELKYPHGAESPVELLESLPWRLPDPDNYRSGYGNQSICLPVFMRNAALEMKRLVGLGDDAYTTVDPETREVNKHCFKYSDICVLVRGKTDAEIAKRILSEAKVPFLHYKEQGIFDTVEAESLIALFDYLAAPGRRGRIEALMLSPLFSVCPSELKPFLRSGDASINKLMDFWQELAAEREWNRLFESVMNDTLLAKPKADDFGFDRRWAIVRQILDRLLETCARTAQTTSEFAEKLRSWRKSERRAEEEGMLRKRESDADRVQIMTMHASKGLEFKVVFVAWGFSALAHMAEEGEKEKVMREEKRLLYVALTRAEHKIYLPWSRWAKHQRISKGESCCEVGIGSVGSGLLSSNGFLAKGIEAYFGSFDAAEKAVKNAVNFESMASGEPSSAKVEEARFIEPKEIKVYDIPLYSKFLKLQYDSYSSLLHHSHTQSAQSSFRKNDSSTTNEAVEVRSLLPKGARSGDVFHEIMETLCVNDDTHALGFQSVGNAVFEELIKEADEDQSIFLGLIRHVLHKHGINNSESCDKKDSTVLTLARMAWNVLNTPINIGMKTFFLKDVPLENRKAEIEFVIDEKLLFGEQLPLLGERERDGVLNGKIDLLVRIGDVYYIVDWKTNTLVDYSNVSLESAMKDSGYDLQYKLYSLAVRQWLGEDAVGGVAYLFVRGGEWEGMQSGVYVPSIEEISSESCRKAVFDALLNGAKNENIEES